MVIENQYNNHYSVDTNFLTSIAQFTCACPEFPSTLQQAISTTYTELHLARQVEDQYNGLYVYTSFAQIEPIVLGNKSAFLMDSATTNSTEGKLIPPYFVPTDSSFVNGITYSRDQKYITTATSKADPVVARIGDDLWRQFPASSTGVISDDRGLRKLITTSTGVYGAVDIIWSTTHHSNLSLSAVSEAMGVLQKVGEEFFRTKRWGKTQIPKQCSFCHRQIMYV